MKFLYLGLILSLSLSASACYNPFKTKKKEEMGIARYIDVVDDVETLVPSLTANIRKQNINPEVTIDFILKILSLNKMPLLLDLDPKEIEKIINIDQLKLDILRAYKKANKEEKIDKVLDVIIDKTVNPINIYLKKSLPSPINLSTDFIDADKLKASLKNIIILKPISALETMDFIDTLAIEKKMGLEENSFSFLSLALPNSFQKFQGATVGIFAVFLIYFICKSVGAEDLLNFSIPSIFIISIILAYQISKKINYNDDFDKAIINSALNSAAKVYEKIQ